ncbi:uncharacterized protein LOC143211589 isoform X2 [Lasioglossum baleicum]|uniref:uncharacterized protein LOC143211589 isoform X2 n=1 Tax=Lasioglossum baleicum TaxID=434251 RepID=UPI003FCD144E
MWPTVYFGIPNRSIRGRFRARAKGHGTRSHKYETARKDRQQHSRTRLVFVERRKQDALKKRKLKLRMPPISRSRKGEKDDAKSLASDMCPNGASDAGYRTRDAIV